MSQDLNTVPNVAQIIQGFTKSALEEFAKIGSKFAKSDFDDWLHRECRELNCLFLGFEGTEASPYIRTEWNTPAQLGSAVRLATYSSGDNATAVFDACLSSVKAMLDLVTSRDPNEIADWGWQLQAMTESLMANLLGFRDAYNEMYEPVCDGVPVTLDDFDAYFLSLPPD